MCIEVHGSERRYLPRRRPVHNFLPQPLPAPPNPRTAGYIPPMATVNPNKKRKPSRCAGVRLAQARETFFGLSAGSVENRRRRLGTRTRHPVVWTKRRKEGTVLE